MLLLDTAARVLNRILTVLAGFILVGMILLTCANIFLRAVWTPINGTYELMGFAGAMLAAFSLSSTQTSRGHIAVDVLVNTFPRKIRSILSAVNNGMCSLFFGLAAWQLVIKAHTLRTTGELTETLRIIYYPFTYAVALGCGVLALILLADFVRQLFSKDAAPS